MRPEGRKEITVHPGHNVLYWRRKGDADIFQAGGTTWAAAMTIANDDVLEQIDATLDGDGNPIATAQRQRFDSAAGTGALGTPTSGVNARVYYSAAYYDNADRTTQEIDVGTNAGTAYTRPTLPTATSNQQYVTNTTYNSAGWLQDSTPGTAAEDPFVVGTGPTAGNLRGPKGDIAVSVAARLARPSSLHPAKPRRVRSRQIGHRADVFSRKPGPSP